MFKKIILTFVLLGSLIAYSSPTYAAETEPTYTQLKVVDAGTFNEFRYKIADAFFTLRNKYDVNWSLDVASARVILDLAKKGYNYLPDSLINKNYFNYLQTAIERGIKNPNNSSNYTEIVTAIENYLDKTNINAIK